ncbi:MAG TPA: response regulator [Microvirga sp.]|nr:response regulator [Microvirga sp.]
MSAATVTPFPRSAPPTILIVEDEVLTRSFISDELRGRGFKVIEASSADDAIAVLDTLRVDLMFVDISLPGSRNGLDVACLVQARGLPTRIILTSGKDRSADSPGSAALGPFIRKPYLVSQVVELVTRCLNWPDVLGS